MKENGRIGTRKLYANELETALHHAPGLDGQVREILQALSGEVVRPFVEGEPIGAYAPLPERKPAPATRATGDLRQERLKHRQRENQQRLTKLIEEGVDPEKHTESHITYADGQIARKNPWKREEVYDYQGYIPPDEVD